jgi:glycerol-3-phosphate dehydrogenase
MNNKIERTLRTLVKKKGGSIAGSVQDGIVQLTGSVPTWDEVVELGFAAGRLKGVKGVVNRVTVHDYEPEKKQKKGVHTQLPDADVVIIGGGVIGCFIARELSRYDLDVTLVEKEADVACGATKANNGQVHTGIGEKPGSLKKELCSKSWPLYQKIADELDVPYRKTGLLVVVTENTLSRIPSFVSRFILKYVVPFLLVRRGRQVGDTPRVMKRNELVHMEPHITDKAIAAVFMPNYAVISPYKLTIALAENAIRNGVTVMLETEVTDITVQDSTVVRVVTDKGIITTQFVVNAAGVFADEVAAMAGAQEYTIHPRKGSILLFDSVMKDYIKTQVRELKFPQDPHTKGGGILLTAHGNIMWGPTAVEVSDKEDTSVTREEIEALVEKYKSTVPNFPLNTLITYFAGVRAATYTEDFVIKPSERVKGFIHAGGIQSPGLAAAPKIAELVVAILEKEGLPLKEKEFDPVRKAPPVFSGLSCEEKKRLIEENPLYGNVVCRCEHVTEAEIVDAICSPLPATTMDAVKRRTRAGMGRCQGGFCSPRVAEILARELQIPLLEVTKKGNGSHLFVRKTKEGFYEG